MISQLKCMQTAKDQPILWRNKLNDLQAAIFTLIVRRPDRGEVDDIIHKINLILETFSPSVQKEVARKEFDSGKEWTMDELLSYLAVIIKRREHLESRSDIHTEGEFFAYHMQTNSTQIRTQLSNVSVAKRIVSYSFFGNATLQQKIEKMKTQNICWKCLGGKIEPIHVWSCHVISATESIIHLYVEVEVFDKMDYEVNKWNGHCAVILVGILPHAKEKLGRNRILVRFENGDHRHWSRNPSTWSESTVHRPFWRFHRVVEGLK